MPKAERAVKGTTKGRGRTNARGLSSAGRSRIVLLGAAVLSAVILVAWFPASALFSQRAALASANTQVRQLHEQTTALTQEQKNLSNAGEIARIAREQYQLVSPGQQAYQVLPPSGTTSAETPYAGDPGTNGPVAPSASVELPPGTDTTTTLPSKVVHATSHRSVAHSGSTASGGAFSRMVRDLEFWR